MGRPKREIGVYLVSEDGTTLTRVDEGGIEDAKSADVFISEIKSERFAGKRFRKMRQVGGDVSPVLESRWSLRELDG